MLMVMGTDQCLEHWTCDQKVSDFIVIKVACKKDPGHSAKSAGGRSQLSTHVPYLFAFE